MRLFDTLHRSLRRAIVLVAASGIALGQTPAAAPAADAPAYTPTFTFDIASIRENPAPADHALHVSNVNPPHASKLELTNFTGKAIIQLAYGFGTPIAGEPDWLSTKYFIVQAKSDPAMDEQLAKLTDDQAKLEKQHMLQALLADRFSLKAHFETRPTSVYLLEIAKGGLKLQENKPAPADPDHPVLAGAQGTDAKATGGRQGLEFDAPSVTTRTIAAMLVSQVGAPVIDKTGLTGNYKFRLQIGREWSANTPDSWPDLFTAVQDQLGLKLESTKEPVPVLVIDHIEPPSAN